MNALAMFASFHFLRPLWLLAIFPALAFALLLWQRKGSAANWRAAIAPDLIDYLLEPARHLRPQWPWLLFSGWLLGVFALAGPTWEKLPQPVLQKRDGLVIVLDLSLSMYAEDIKPSRLERARFKVLDILQQRREGLTGLVVYSGDAHVVSPLTDDTATIANLIPALAPAIMPSFGSNTVAGIDTALQLLRNAGFERGRVLLLSDEIAENDIDKIAALIDGNHWQLSIIGIGSEQGAPIPLPRDDNRTRSDNERRDDNQGGFLKQDNGTIAIAQLHRDRMQQLAAKIHGRYDDIRIDDNDIAQVLPPADMNNDTVRTLEREFDQWRERGPQIVMLLLPLAAFAFRRGWLLLLFVMPFSSPSQAWEWQDLWQRPDQQAQQEFNAGNTKAAAEKFRDPNWRGAAQYRSGDFAAAAESLQNIDNADAQYNRGNALAHDGKLEDAIAAYDAALKKNPALTDAKANREIAEKLLQQQKNQSKNSSPNNSPQKNQSNDAQQNNPQQSGQSSPQDQTPSNSDQKNGAQKNGEQKNSDNASQQNNDGTSQQNNKNASTQNNNDSPQQNDRQDGSSSNHSAEQKNQAPNNANSMKNANSANNESQKLGDPAQKGSDKAQALQNETDKTLPKSGERAASEQLTPEQKMQQRATEQWLRQIPDDPSGLLRRKFLYENRQRNQQPQNDGKPLW